MSLPKRDGVHDRYYLIHKPDTSPEVLAEADLCIQDVLNGTARENHSAYPTVVRNHNGTPFLPDQLLERYLTGLPLKEFPCDVAVSLCDAMRRLVGWEEIRYTLEKYIEKQVQERFFLVGERDDGFTVFPPCTVLPELHPEDVDEGLLRFACYVAICHTVYGQSFESLTTEHILGLVSQIRPDMVKELKTNGSGKLPPNIQKRKTKHLTASANDAFATIRITAKDCGGVVIFRGKILVLYKNYRNKYEGWVLPKGTVEAGEEFKETALREVKEETGVQAQIIKYIGKSQYSFNTPQDTVEKEVHWYLMMADSYYSKPQREEYFVDSGYYKYYEAYHLLKFSNEKQILEKAYHEYLDLKRCNLWGSKKYF